MDRIDSLDRLHAIYGVPGPASTVKEVDRITPDYARMMAASPFLALATVGPEGLDCSPRGDRGSVVRIADERTLWLPDRRGNNRVDSLRNIVRDPRVALLFLIPGSGSTLRVNGRAHLSVDPALLDGLAIEGQRPRSVIVIRVETIYFQCARAVIRAGLWQAHAAPDVPTPGQILARLSAGQVGGETYDREWPARAAASMW
jgi:hypothetical protein